MLAARLMESANKRSSIDAVRRLEISNGEHVLEIGPGNGDGLVAMAKSSPGRIVAVEISDRFRGILRDRDIKNLEVYDADAKAMSFVPSGSVDKLLAMNVVYFLHPLSSYASELKRVLKPGRGHCILGCKFLATSHGNPNYFVNKDLTKIKSTLQAAGLLVHEEHIDLGNPVESYIALHLRTRVEVEETNGEES